MAVHSRDPSRARSRRNRTAGAAASATRVVVTVGPASSSNSVLGRMIRAGASVFRFNMSHGDHESHAGQIERVRQVAERSNVPVGVLVDLQGPKIRTGSNEGGERIPLRRGQTVRVVGGGKSSAVRIAVSFSAVLQDLKKGDRILLDDGRLSLRVERRRGDELEAKVERGGSLKERAGVNVPGRLSGVRVPTRKDREDAAFAVEHGADFVALSFVQSADDLIRLRRYLNRLSKECGQRPPAIVAKIEKPAALDRLDEILEETDGVMVARGDLGVEISLAQVPVWQKEILFRARREGVFSITATQMLESMTSSSIPTRAEVSDVANAVFDGTDALMLSAESAIGDYPVESVQALNKIAHAAEDALPDRESFGPDVGGDPHWRSAPIYALVRAAIELAAASHAVRIVAVTKTGHTAFLLARHRSSVPVVALTPSDRVRRRLTLAWNTVSLLQPEARNVEELMEGAVEAVRKARLVRSGETLVLVGGANNPPGLTNMVRLIRVP